MSSKLKGLEAAWYDREAMDARLKRLNALKRKLVANATKPRVIDPRLARIKRILMGKK